MTDQSLNLDFEKSVVINANKQKWVASPAAGVYRKPFERDAAEHGRATSIVRFGAGANFKTHTHPKGEEILVLDGVFSDENGDYPAGTYLRHPPGSSHAPHSKEGCVIFVKLDHFHADDMQRVIIHPERRQWRQGIGNLKVVSLHEHLGEHTALVKWPANEHFQPHQHWGGEEILVLEGEFCDEHGQYPQGTWIRSPHLSKHNPFTEQATLILVKVGHLPE